MQLLFWLNEHPLTAAVFGLTIAATETGPLLGFSQKNAR